MKLQRFLLTLFAPFTLLGGMLVGYFSYAIRVTTEPAPLTFAGTVMSTHPHAEYIAWMALGVVLITLGMWIRHRIMKKIADTLVQREGLAELRNGIIDDLQAQLAETNMKIGWIEQTLKQSLPSTDDATIPERYAIPPEPDSIYG